MGSCELSMGVSAFANALANNLSDDGLDVASAVFTQLGDTLATISAQRSICNRRKKEI